MKKILNDLLTFCFSSFGISIIEIRQIFFLLSSNYNVSIHYETNYYVNFFVVLCCAKKLQTKMHYLPWGHETAIKGNGNYCYFVDCNLSFSTPGSLMLFKDTQQSHKSAAYSSYNSYLDYEKITWLKYK